MFCYVVAPNSGPENLTCFWLFCLCVHFCRANRREKGRDEVLSCYIKVTLYRLQSIGLRHSLSHEQGSSHVHVIWYHSSIRSSASLVSADLHRAAQVEQWWHARRATTLRFLIIWLSKDRGIEVVFLDTHGYPPILNLENQQKCRGDCVILFTTHPYNLLISNKVKGRSKSGCTAVGRQNLSVPKTVETVILVGRICSLVMESIIVKTNSLRTSPCLHLNLPCNELWALLFWILWNEFSSHQ